VSVEPNLRSVFLATAEHSGRTDAGATIVDAAIMISKSIDGLTAAIHKLGVADALTPMGALEAYGDHMGRVTDSAAQLIADALEDVAQAIRDHATAEKS
jgi:hypothetical protein